MVGVNHGTMSQQQGADDTLKKQLEMAHDTIRVLTLRVDGCEKLLDEKDKRIEVLEISLRDKERLIVLYESQQSKP